MKKFIHKTFNPAVKTAIDVIDQEAKPLWKFEEVVYINSYEAVCIFSEEKTTLTS